ncbi:MAG: ribose-phosphate diphosphokinase, partial [Candidatus Woesearchaeota archaeon]
MKLRLITGTRNVPLAEDISMHLGIPLVKRIIKRFMDGEIYIQISENLRGDDVFIIQSVSNPVNDSLMELLILIDALKRASAGRITAVITYYGYARQDRKAEAREPITAKLVADMIASAGADRVLTIDMHTPQIQGFFNIPVDEVSAIPLFAKYFAEKGIIDGVVVSPDSGGVKRARSFASRLHMPIAIIDKRRTAHNEAEVVNVVGDIAGKTAILIDDIIDTGNSIVKSAEELSKTAKEVYICATHPVFSIDCIKKLEDSKAKEIVVSNTINIDNKCDKIKVINMAKFLSDVISNI